MRRQLLLLALLCALCGAERAAAQYYTWGSDPPQKWSAIRTPDVRMIYPDTVAGIARRTLFYIRSVRPDIGYGFRHGPMRIPFVMHPENFQSNGLVMYLPKRVEFLTSPAVDSYSMPWYKQLVAHEYRHAVQYNNLDRGVIRALSYVLGQQGSTIGLLCMPIWAMEGDAVMSETMHSSFGRGLQPSFSMAYRAMGSVGRDRRNIDRWFCGSYRDYIPDHYELGYQICSYAWERYGENIWDKVAWYGSRNPYVLATTRVALGKFYKTNVIKLFRETFDELERYWDSLPETGDSAVPLTALPEKNHTTYQWPLPLGDTAVVALKTDLDRVSRFVVIDRRTGGERTVCHTGLVSTRPSMAASGGPSTAVPRFSNSASTRNCVTWTSPTVCPARRNGSETRSIPRLRARSSDGSSTIPTAVIRSWCGTARVPNGGSKRPSGRRFTDWRGTIVRWRGTSSSRTTAACGSAASTPTACTRLPRGLTSPFRTCGPGAASSITARSPRAATRPTVTT